MEYLNVKARVNELLSKKKAALTALVMLLMLLLYAVRVLNILFATGSDVLDFIVSWLLNLVCILIANTIFFCILAHSRKEAFGMKQVRYSLSHLPIQILLGILYTLIRFVIDLALGTFALFLPLIYIPVYLCLIILYLSVECSIAYCIYDGGVNAAEIVRGMFLFIKAKWRILLRSGTAYLLSNFLYVLCLSGVIGGSVQMSGNMLDISKTIAYIASDPMGGTMLSIIGLTLIFWAIFAYLELRVFMTTAVVYEGNQPLYFSRIKIKNAG